MRPNASTLLPAGSRAFLTANVTAIRYLTGITMSSGMLLAQPKGYTLFADSRYTEYAHAHAPKGVTVRGPEKLDAILARVSICSFHEEEITVGRLKRWKKRFKKTSFKSVADPLHVFRRTKSEEERRCLRRALRITNVMLKRVPAILKPGVTEKDVAWKLEMWARELGAEKLSFEPIVAFGTHTSYPHHHPTNRKLVKGMIVQIDTGAVYGGYHADRSEVYFTAKPNAEQARMYAAVLEAKNAAKQAAKAGASVRALDILAREIFAAHGLEKYFPYALGHGVGLEIHEGVTLSRKAPDDTLLKHEVITIEPGLHIPGKYGMRLEDMVFVQ